MFSGIANQKFELLNEQCDSDYSMSSENSDENNESDSDSSVHSNVETVQPKVNNTNISLRRSARKKEVSYVSVYYIFTLFAILFLNVM